MWCVLGIHTTGVTPSEPLNGGTRITPSVLRNFYRWRNM